MKKYLSGGACAAIAGAAMLLSFAATPAEAQAPGGSYLQSCRDVRAHGDRVSALCRRSDGSWSRTAINDVHSCNGGLANANGNLTCGRRGAQHGSNRDDRRDHRGNREHREGYGSSYGPGQYQGGNYWHGR